MNKYVSFYDFLRYDNGPDNMQTILIFKRCMSGVFKDKVSNFL